MGDSQPMSTRDREIQLANVVRQIMEKNSQIDHLKSLIQEKTLLDLRGKDTRLLKQACPSPEDRSGNAVVYAVNELIMEYFHWFGYQYSAEMFSTEVGCASTCPDRATMESKLGKRDRDMPILVSLVLNMLRRNQKVSSSKSSFK